MLRKITFFEGVESESVPTIVDLIDKLNQFANDAAYVSDKGSAAEEGDIYANTTDNCIRYYNGSEWVSISYSSLEETLTNKDIDGGSASNSNRITIPKNDRTTLDGLTRKQATLLYDTDNDSLLIDDGSELTELGGGNTTIDVNQESHGFSVLTPIYLDSGTWKEAQANASDTLATHIIIEVVDSDNFVCSQFGKYTISSHGKTVDEYYFTDKDTAGDITTIEPTTGYSNPLFYVEDANTIHAMVYRPSSIGDGIVSDSEIGLIQDFAGSNLPTGFLWCDGQAVSRTTYADLYAKIGTRFGVGDGSTTFNVPFDTTLKQYSLSFDANPSGWSSIRSYGVPYKVYDESGNEVWHLKGTIVGEYTSAATGTFTISGVTFKNVTDFKEPVIVDGGNKTGQGRTVANSGSIDFWFDTAGDAVRIDFDAELESKPTFVDDNSTSDYQITKIIRYAPKGALQATSSSTESISIAQNIPATGGASIYFCTNAADTADITHTLPAAATAGAGAEFTFIKTDSTTYDIIIDGNGSETINGYSSITLDCQNARIKIVSDGSNWQILYHYLISEINLMPKNYIINGDMRVSQRGDYTSASSASNDTYYVDRWKSLVETISSNVQHISSSQPSDLKGSKSLKYIATSSDSGRLAAYQIIEDYELFDSKQVTFSAYVKSNSSNARLQIYDGTTSFFSSAHSGGENWERLEVTATLGTTSSSLQTSVKISDSSNSAVAISSGDYIEFTGAKLEFGYRASVFVPRSFGEELSLCQRYFEKSLDIEVTPDKFTSSGTSGCAYFQASDYGLSSVSTNINFKQTKRNTPLISTYANANSSINKSQGDTVYYHISGNVDYNDGVLQIVGTSSFSINFFTFANQNLYMFHWTADAEL